MPAALHEEGLDALVCEKLALGCEPADLSEWDALARRIRRAAARSRSRSSASTSRCKDAYLSVAEALKHAGIHHARVSGSRWVDAEGAECDEVTRRQLAARGRDPRSGWLRRPGDRGQGARRAGRPRARDPVSRDLPRDADRGDRVRAQCLRPRGRQFERVRSRDSVPGDRSPAGAEGDRGHGRHDAPRRQPGRSRWRRRRRTPRTARPRSTSATATATR